MLKYLLMRPKKTGTGTPSPILKSINSLFYRFHLLVGIRA